MKQWKRENRLLWVAENSLLAYVLAGVRNYYYHSNLFNLYGPLFWNMAEICTGDDVPVKGLKIYLSYDVAVIQWITSCHKIV